MSIAEEMLALARERNFEALESAWMQQLEPEPREIDELLRVADYLVRRKFSDRAEVFLWSLITAVSEKHGAAEGLDLARRAVLIAPESATLRQELAAAYKAARPEVGEWDVILEASDLARTSDPAPALAFIEDCLRLRPGAFVIHALSRRVGRVAGFSDGMFVVEAEGRRQQFPPKEIFTHWEPMPEDDFRALAVYEPALLRKLAEEDPAALVTMILRSLKGSSDLKGIKSALVPAVIDLAAWSGWWSSVRVALKRTPGIEFSGSTAQPVLTLRDEDADYAQSFRRRFDDAPEPWDKVRCVVEYLAEMDAGHEADGSLLEYLGGELMRMGQEADSEAVAVALLSAARAIHVRNSAAPDPSAVLGEKLSACGGIAQLIAAVQGEEALRIVLAAFKVLPPERAAQLYAEAFPSCSLRSCDTVARELADAGRTDLLRKAVEQALAFPNESAEAFGWSWRKLVAEEDECLAGLDVAAATVTFLHLVNRLGRLPRHAANRAAARESLSKLRAIIGAKRCQAFEKVLAECDAAAARRLHEAVASNEGITETIRHEMLEMLRERYPDEFVQRKNLWEDGHYYSTAEGLAQRRATFEKLVNEDMARNAEAIGRAASRGDLRENWEYKTALEERDRLVERVTRAREELEAARVLTSDMIPDGEVNIGTSVRIRNVSGGAERTITFLGPWDADIPRGIYSYLAPLSLRFMGRKVGDRVSASFDDIESEFEILGIEKVI